MIRQLPQSLLFSALRAVANANIGGCSFHAVATLNSALDRDNFNPTLDRIKKELAEDKAKLQWRTPAGDSPEDWNSKFKLFENSEQTSDYIIMMQQPVDLSSKGIKKWLEKRREQKERFMQQYMHERHDLLGADLAAAHFIIYRGGSAKFHNSPKWVRADEYGEFNLPRKFKPDYKLEALRCDHMTLYYEGLENIRCLNHLKFLSFHNVTTFDDWCLDRVSGSQFTALEILDISGTKCTHNGLSCIYRIPSLQLLVVDDPKRSAEFELSCSMLEEVIPKLKVVAASEMHSQSEEES